MTADHMTPTESVAEFAARARAWLADNMPAVDPDDRRRPHRATMSARGKEPGNCKSGSTKADSPASAFPASTVAWAWTTSTRRHSTTESLNYEMPLILNIPTFTICCATLLDTGTEEQKKQHIAAALRGDEVLVQLLSEPSGGSDLAGVITRAERHGDRWIINGAKTWSTSAFAADYGLCLARTNWDVPKHEGLTMFLVPIRHPGITLRHITMLSGSTEFCEEFLDGVDVGDDAVVGEVNGGWAVASRQLYHERRAVGQGSEFASGSGSEGGNSNPVDYVGLVEKTGQADNERVREMAGRVLVHRAVAEQLIGHVFRKVRDGVLPPAAGTLIRLFHSDTVTLDMDTALAISGAASVVGQIGEGLETGLRYLSRQNVAIGGGTTEMARNVIGERVLGFPREYAADRGVPFNQVRHGQTR